MSDYIISSKPDHSKPDNLIQPFVRIFAIEIQQSDLVINGNGDRQRELITPSGARLSRLYICGVLTEIIRNTKGGGSIRIADPTGVFIIHLKIKNPDISTILDTLSIPAFVSITAYIEPSIGSGGQTGYNLVLDTIHPSTRSDRDRWICRTGYQTLIRLKRVSDVLSEGHCSGEEKRAIQWYKTSILQLKMLAGIIEKAVNQVQKVTQKTEKPEEDKSETPDMTAEKVLLLIKQQSGPKGVAVQDLLPLAEQEKIPESLLIDTIRYLIAEDEIYQPSSGFVKIL
jgi:RPA family protein